MRNGGAGSLVLASPFRGKYPGGGMGAPGWDMCQGLDLAAASRLAPPQSLRASSPFRGALYLLPPLGGSTPEGGWGRRGGMRCRV